MKGLDISWHLATGCYWSVRMLSETYWSCALDRKGYQEIAVFHALPSEYFWRRCFIVNVVNKAGKGPGKLLISDVILCNWHLAKDGHGSALSG
jgi:hypothetical protein